MNRSDFYTSSESEVLCEKYPTMTVDPDRAIWVVAWRTRSMPAASFGYFRGWHDAEAYARSHAVTGSLVYLKPCPKEI